MRIIQYGNTLKSIESHDMQSQSKKWISQVQHRNNIIMMSLTYTSSELIQCWHAEPAEEMYAHVYIHVEKLMQVKLMELRE